MMTKTDAMPRTWTSGLLTLTGYALAIYGAVCLCDAILGALR